MTGWIEFDRYTRARLCPGGVVLQSYTYNDDPEHPYTSEALVFIPCSVSEAIHWIKENKLDT